jgi:hypothetical protein
MKKILITLGLFAATAVAAPKPPKPPKPGQSEFACKVTTENGATAEMKVSLKKKTSQLKAKYRVPVTGGAEGENLVVSVDGIQVGAMLLELDDDALSATLNLSGKKFPSGLTVKEGSQAMIGTLGCSLTSTDSQPKLIKL